jgi:hypothetical protein
MIGAGHFAPAIASRIFKGNKAKEGSIINLQVPPLFNPSHATEQG